MCVQLLLFPAVGLLLVDEQLLLVYMQLLLFHAVGLLLVDEQLLLFHAVGAA